MKKILEKTLLFLISLTLVTVVQVRSIKAAGYAIVNFKTKSSASITQFTSDLGGTSINYINGFYGVDGAFLGYSSDGTKVHFMMAGVEGWVNKSDVEVVDLSNVAQKSYYQVDSKGSLIHYIIGYGGTVDVSTVLSPINLGTAPEYLRNGVRYYSYDGHYFYSDAENTGYQTMIDDYNQSQRGQSVNVNSPFFNYFQFLPFRSKTNYSAAELDTISANKTLTNSKLRNQGSAFIENQNNYGSNALLMYSVAVNESTWGISSIALNKNNLFGAAAGDADPGNGATPYDSPAASIKAFAYKFVNNNYTDPADDKYFGGYLGDKSGGFNVRYASDPYWGEKAASIAWQLDNESGKKDQLVAAVGVYSNLDGSPLNVRKEASGSSPIIYSSGKQKYQPYILLGSSNGFYQVQTDGALNASRTAVQLYDVYNFDNSYGYVSQQFVAIMNAARNSVDGIGIIANTNSISIGAAYTSADKNIEFRWQVYNTATSQWVQVSDWAPGNWSSWYPYAGNYWINVDMKLSDGTIISKIVTYTANKDYGIRLSALASVDYFNRIDVGVAYTGTDPQAKFRWLSYNLDTQQWQIISDWASGNWSSWYPNNGNYWLRSEVSSNGVVSSLTQSYTVNHVYNTSINGIIVQNANQGINVGVSYNSNYPEPMFRWLTYNLQTQQWQVISDWASGNWSNWQPPTPGNYWIRSEIKTGSGLTTQTVSYTVQPRFTLNVNDIYSQITSTSIDFGASFTSNDPNVEFKWQVYNVKTGQWSLISDWASGNWTSWQAETGDYWINVDARTSDGMVKSKLIEYTSTKDFKLKINDISVTRTASGFDAIAVFDGPASEMNKTQFRWLVYDLNKKTWTIVADWSSSASFKWTVSTGNYWLRAEARNTTQSADLTISVNLT